jgi:hypothetical protein
MASLTGKEIICFIIVLPHVRTSGAYTPADSPPCRLDIISDLEAVSILNLRKSMTTRASGRDEHNE